MTDIRKWHTIIEEVHTTEIGRLADDTPLVKLVIAATILNPYAGQFGTDLSAAAGASRALGQMFAGRLIEAASLPTRMPSTWRSHDFERALKLDKKRAGEGVEFVLIDRLGHALTRKLGFDEIIAPLA